MIEIISMSGLIELDPDNTDMLLLDLSLFRLVLLEEILPGTPRDEIVNAIVEDTKSFVDGLEPSALDDLLALYISDNDDDAVIESYNDWFCKQDPKSTSIRYGEALRELLIDELPLDDEQFKYLGCVITPENPEACTIYYTVGEVDDKIEDEEEEIDEED